MVSSVTDVCNFALAHLGEARITSVAEDSVSARACGLHYNATRREILRAHRWNFAKRRAVLSELTPVPAFGWAHRFGLPDDCLRVLEVNDTESGIRGHDSEWEIEGRELLTNADGVKLVYIADAQEVSEFDALFIEALAVKLAIDLSETIRGSTGKTEDLERKYQAIVAPLAQRTDGNESRRRKGLLPDNSLSIRARMGGGGWRR